MIGGEPCWSAVFATLNHDAHEAVDTNSRGQDREDGSVFFVFWPAFRNAIRGDISLRVLRGLIRVNHRCSLGELWAFELSKHEGGNVRARDGGTGWEAICNARVPCSGSATEPDRTNGLPIEP